MKEEEEKLIVTKVYGPNGRSFLVVAKDNWEALRIVEAKIISDSYWTEEDLEGEISTDDNVYLDTTKRGLVEL